MSHESLWGQSQNSSLILCRSILTRVRYGCRNGGRKLCECQDLQTSDDVHFTAISGKVLDRWQMELHPLQTVITEHVAVIWTDSRWSRRTACHRSVSQSLPHRAWRQKTHIIVDPWAGGNVPWREDIWEMRARVSLRWMFFRVTPGWGFQCFVGNWVK